MRVDSKTGDFKSLGEFLVAARKAIDGEHMDSRLNDPIFKTMTESSDSGGGFTVPEKWADQIYHAMLENSIVRSRAIVLPMTSDTLNIRVLVDSDRSSNIFGGITFTWIEETGQKADEASDPVIGNRKLTAHEGVAVTFVQNQLEDDYGKFESFIKLAFGRAIRFYEDDFFIQGSGAGEPLGIMKSGYLVTPTRTAINKIDITDFGNMAKRLLPGSWPFAIWLINPSVFTELLELQAAAANSASVIDFSRMTILNRPIIVTEKCAQMGTSGDIILADFDNGYFIGDRSMEISGSRHFDYSSGTYGFLKNQTCWRIVLRVDGQPILDSAIIPKRGAATDTLSNFVALTTTS